MKTRRNANATIWTAVLAATLLPALAGAQGISLSVGNTVPVTNVLGRTLPGTDGDPGHACQVEIRETWTGGFILPPTDENLETFNPTITNSYLGCGVVGENSGTYSEGFNDRSVFRTNQLYYVRVFNLPLTYYADTPAFFGPPDDVSSINPEFGPLQRVDGEEDVDSDGDGIPDMLEDSELSTSPSEPDTDGDTYGDWFEAYYSDYMDPLSDPANKEAPIELDIQSTPLETDPHVVSWWTLPVPGLTYRLEYRPRWNADTSFTNLIWEGAANSNAYQEVPVDASVPPDEPMGFFRVTVPYPGP